MARLPQPGGDNGNWGDILNDYLAQSHKADGTLKDGSVTASILASDSVSKGRLTSSLRTEIDTKLTQAVADTAYAPMSVKTEVEGRLSEEELSTTYVSKPGTRKAVAPLTAPNSITIASALDFTQRSMMKLPFAAPEWRMGFRNKSLRSASVLTTPCTINGLWTGAPVRNTATNSNGRWAGDTVATPTKVADALTVPTDGTFAYTPWVSNDPFAKNTEKVLSWGITSENIGNGVGSGNSYQGVRAVGAANAGTAALSGAAVGTSLVYLDVVLEYRFSESVKVVLFIGDSNTASYGFNPVVPGISNTGLGALPFESWPMLAGAMGGFAAINLGVGSTTIGDWATLHPYLWDRLGTAVGPIDAAILSLGTNGVGAGLLSYSGGMQTINAKCRNDYSVSTLWHTTITPRGFTTFGRLTSASVAGATSVVLDGSPANGLILIGSGHNMEQVTVSAVSGTGPYMATVGALINSHSIGEPVSWGDEMQRRIINSFIRNLPDGITGAFDFEKLLEASPDSNVCDPRYIGADGLHFYRGAGIEKARAVIGAGVQPLFM